MFTYVSKVTPLLALFLVSIDALQLNENPCLSYMLHYVQQVAANSL